jgi:hypothetical protein
MVLATRSGRFCTVRKTTVIGSHGASAVIALPGASRQPEARLIQLLRMIGLQYFVDVSRYPADDAYPKMFAIAQQIGTQSPADERADPFVSKDAQPIEGAHVQQKYLLANRTASSVFAQNEHLGAPVEHRRHSEAEYRYGQPGSFSMHPLSSYASASAGN